MKTTSKKFFEVVWLFRISFEVYILKIIMSTLRKFFLKLFGLFRKFSKVHTLKRVVNKNSLKSFNCFELFLSAYKMIFNNLGFVDLSPELDFFFLWQIAGRILSKNFALSIGGNDLKVALCHIDFLFC